MRTHALAFLVALGLAPGARAQTDAPIGPDWAGPIGEAFFSDPEMTALRPEAELRRNWDALPEADRAQVLRDCTAMTADAADVAGAASGGVSDIDPAEAAPSAEAQAPAAEGAENALGDFSLGGSEAMAEACALVAQD